MRFIAFTQPTATWLLGHHDAFNRIATGLHSIAAERELRKSVFVDGPIRIAATADGQNVALWHSDYLGASGNESWGLLRLDGVYGALSEPNPSVILKSALAVIDARLQNLLLPFANQVRSHDEGVFTALMGRGGAKQSASIGYFETQHQGSRSVLVIGPAHDHGNLERSLTDLASSLRSLAPSAGSIIEAIDQLPIAAKQRPATEPPSLHGLRTAPREAPGPAEPIKTSALTEVFGVPLPSLTYEEWMLPGSALGSEKRKLLESDFIDMQPLRITGPAGSGKSLLMQLMAVRAAKKPADGAGAGRRILYLVHNVELMHATRERFEKLWPTELRPDGIGFEVLTLQAYCQARLNIETSALLDEDAAETKDFQCVLVADAIKSRLARFTAESHPLFNQIRERPVLIEVLAQLTVNEIGIVIKGYGLSEDRRRYVASERSLSRFHRLLNASERELVFDVYKDYQKQIFEEGGFLDADDLAISMLNQLRTPVWQLKRRTEGYDYLFVDETQLYNENERRLFALLTRKASGMLPIAIALDDAQTLASASTSGFATLGLPSIRNEALHSIYRSTPAILKLAFSVIQQTTDLFDNDFPDYTRIAKSCVPDDHEKACPPALWRAAADESVPVATARLAAALRGMNHRQVCVISMVHRAIPAISAELRSVNQEPLLITHRGQTIDNKRPFVAVASPSVVGGQEFDAVILTGLEAGAFPPYVSIQPLAVSLEQEALRHLYLSLTRARYQVHIVLSHGSALTPLLAGAVKDGLLTALPNSPN